MKVSVGDTVTIVNNDTAEEFTFTLVDDSSEYTEEISENWLSSDVDLGRDMIGKQVGDTIGVISIVNIKKDKKERIKQLNLRIVK